MSKKCFIDNEKLGMMTNSFKTKDGNVLCAKHVEDITNKIAGNRLMLLGLGLQGSAQSLTPSYLAAILK